MVPFLQALFLLTLSFIKLKLSFLKSVFFNLLVLAVTLTALAQPFCNKFFARTKLGLTAGSNRVVLGGVVLAVAGEGRGREVPVLPATAFIAGISVEVD
jgi:hypothetical protein